MKVSAFTCATAFASLVLFGCASPIHKHDTFGDTNPVDFLSIDAKQRVVFVVRQPDKNGKQNTVTCAEPSPDALSALSNSVGGSLQDPKVAASFAASQVESAASIGLRTTSIQLLRDGMYHLCEQYAAGGMTGEMWVREQRRYQNLMLSLLSIEQLTGAVSPRQVGLGGGSASSTVGDRAGDAAADVAKANGDLTAAQTALTKAQDTQTSDQKACTADSTSATCANAAADATAVTNAKKSVDEATENQKTAREALQAARGAVTAEATGAKVSFSDASKPYQMTDASARYVSEATRSIVTTTLLASFAQEECTRVWDFLDKVPPENLSDFIRGYTAPNTKQDSSASTHPSEIGAQAVASLQGEIVQLARNCQANEKQLLAQPAMFTPQYGQEAGASLKVLGAANGVTLELKQAVSLIIVGGVRPYHVSGLTPDLAKELEATIPSPQDGTVFSLNLQRPDGAVKTTGSMTISVADSANANIDIPVSFSKPLEKTPDAKPSGSAKITAVTSKDAQFKVSFTPPTPATVKGYVAKASNQTKGSTEVLQGTGAADAKEIDIDKCQVAASYTISLEVTPATGSATTVKYSKPIKCEGTAASPAPTPATPRPPTDVQAQAQAGGKIVVSFKAAATSTDAVTVTGYTAVAAPVTEGGKPVKDKPTLKPVSTPDGKVATITLVGCAAQTHYVATVVAAAGKLASVASAAKPVECQR